MKLDELREVIGRVTISFAVDVETKYLLQLGAKKAGVTFSEYCRQVIEGNLPREEKRKEKEKKEEQTTPEYSNVIYATYKQDFIDKLKKVGYKKSVDGLIVKQGHPITVQIGREKQAKITRLQHSEWKIEY